MYQIGDRVVYGIHGVCEIAAMEERIVDHKRLEYLALKPLDHGGSRFLVPAHNAAAMAKLQKILTREELDVLLNEDAIHSVQWIPEEKRRKALYKELQAGCDRKILLQMIYSIYRHKEIQFAAGKKVHQCDENFLRDAEKRLAGEIAIVMETDYPNALQYLREKLKGHG